MIIDPETKEKIDALVKLAEENPFDVRHMEGGKENLPVNKLALPNEFTIRVPPGFVVTFAHEIQKSGLFRHIQVCVVGVQHMLPTPEVVESLMEAFGMGKIKLGKGSPDLAKIEHLWLGEVEPGHRAVNISQRINPATLH